MDKKKPSALEKFAQIFKPSPEKSKEYKTYGEGEMTVDRQGNLVPKKKTE